MLIDGPLKLQIIENDGNRELHITFKEEYQRFDLQSRIYQMKQHLNDLHTYYNASNDAVEKQGMQMIIQVVAQVLPLIEAEEIATEETIILELSKTTPINDLVNNVNIN